jgi:putative transposase
VNHVLNSIKRLTRMCFQLLHQNFRDWTKPPLTSLMLGTVHDLARSTRIDRILLVLLARLVRTWKQALFIVQPETLLRWHRQGCATVLEV